MYKCVFKLPKRERLSLPPVEFEFGGFHVLHWIRASVGGGISSPSLDSVVSNSTTFPIKIPIFPRLVDFTSFIKLRSNCLKIVAPQ